MFTLCLSLSTTIILFQFLLEPLWYVVEAVSIANDSMTLKSTQAIAIEYTFGNRFCLHKLILKMLISVDLGQLYVIIICYAIESR